MKQVQRIARSLVVGAVAAVVSGHAVAQTHVRFADIWQANLQAGTYFVNLHRDEVLVFDTSVVVLDGRPLVVNAHDVLLAGHTLIRAFPPGQTAASETRPGGAGAIRSGQAATDQLGEAGGDGGQGRTGSAGRPAPTVTIFVTGQVLGEGALDVDLRGETGGRGGPGGVGGNGQWGGNGANARYHLIRGCLGGPNPGRDGGAGGNGGRGGAGGRGGDGGALVASAALRRHVDLVLGGGQGGTGGPGGSGGRGGAGGSRGSREGSCTSVRPNGNPGRNGASGAAGPTGVAGAQGSVVWVGQ